MNEKVLMPHIELVVNLLHKQIAELKEENERLREKLQHENDRTKAANQYINALLELNDNKNKEIKKLRDAIILCSGSCRLEFEDK